MKQKCADKASKLKKSIEEGERDADRMEREESEDSEESEVDDQPDEDQYDEEYLCGNRISNAQMKGLLMK